MVERKRHLTVKTDHLTLTGKTETLTVYRFSPNTRFWTDGTFGFREGFTTSEIQATKVMDGRGKQMSKKGRKEWEVYIGGSAINTKEQTFGLQRGTHFYTYEKGAEVKTNSTPL